MYIDNRQNQAWERQLCRIILEGNLKNTKKEKKCKHNISERNKSNTRIHTRRNVHPGYKYNFLESSNQQVAKFATCFEG